ncbi:MAG: site-specific integrase, partial [Methylotenera sp.]
MSEQTLTLQNSAELDTFIDHLWLEDGLAKNTLESYRLDLTSFALWLPSQDKQLLTVDQADIQQYLAVKFPQSKPRSISRLIASLRRFYRYCLR